MLAGEEPNHEGHLEGKGDEDGAFGGGEWVALFHKPSRAALTRAALSQSGRLLPEVWMAFRTARASSGRSRTANTSPSAWRFATLGLPIFVMALHFSFTESP
jgi:hypothetical protein